MQSEEKDPKSSGSTVRTTRARTIDLNEEHSWSFACGGWLKMYLFGVAKFIQENELINEKKSTFVGSSAGALTATGLALGCDFDAIKNFIVEDVIPRTHGHYWGPFQVRKYLDETLERFGNLHNYEKLNESQKLHVNYTSLNKCQARRVSSFTSKEALKKTLLASCCASPIAGMPFKHEGEWIFDGGISDFQPIVDEKTITVSPFYCTNADIHPSRYVPMWWALYPPCQENIEWLFQLGYEDAQNWALKQGLIQATASPRQSHAARYDGAWDSNFGRFIGYKALENRFLDFLFVVSLVLLWKPLAFSLMYTELVTRALISASRAALFGVACRIMISVLVLGITTSLSATMVSLEHTVMILVAVASVFVSLVAFAGGLGKASDIAVKDWKACLICLRTIASLSLLLRTVPFIGSTVPIKRHQFLIEHSFVYRLTSHFV